jgi:hypothetical protein
MVEFEIPDKLISNVLKVGGVLIVLVMVATLIRPSITGNVVNRMNELNENLTVCTTALADVSALAETQEEAISVMSSDVSNLTELYQDCSVDLSNVSGEVAFLRAEIENTERVFENMEIALNETENDYRDLAEFAAKAKCCQLKVLDNPDIDSYDIQSNKIVCQVDSDGEYTLEC